MLHRTMAALAVGVIVATPVAASAAESITFKFPAAWDDRYAASTRGDAE